MPEMNSPSQIYFVETSSEDQRSLLCRWVEYFYEAGRKVQVLADSSLAAQHLDQLLWTFSQGSFVPHRIVFPHGTHAGPEPVVITTVEARIAGFEVLVCDAPGNLELLEQYPMAMHFVVLDDQERRQQSRLLWQAARDAGLQVRHVPRSKNSPPHSA